MHNYHGAYDVLPGNHNASHSVALLPYIGQSPLHERFDSRYDAYHPTNQPIGLQSISSFRCPSATTYFIEPDQWIAAESAANTLTLGKRFSTFTDGTSNTAAGFEIDGSFGLAWIIGPELEIGIQGERHPAGWNVLYGDGRVRPISRSVDVDLVRALGTPGGGEAALPP